MKVAIIGAGAIGGYVGVKLALAGEDVTFIVRGANLTAIRQRGMKLIMADGSEHVARNVRATNDYSEAGAQDVVILAMKAHQVEAVARDVPKLFGPDTAVVTMQNGIPYWYFHKHGGRAARARACKASTRPASSANAFRPSG
jgi:2-dehydropantoate 2-reductase